jgi:hypothetical protein
MDGSGRGIGRTLAAILDSEKENDEENERRHANADYQQKRVKRIDFSGSGRGAHREDRENVH